MALSPIDFALSSDNNVNNVTFILSDLSQNKFESR